MADEQNGAGATPAGGPTRWPNSVVQVVPTLRFFDLDRAKQFYVDYLGCGVDWEEGGTNGPMYLQVSRGSLVLHLSSHHDDGTPGTVVLVEIERIHDLHAELASRGYAFMNPGIEPGPGTNVSMELIDPFSNRIRFFERAR
jgi:ribosomal-protein-alanine N-acetyltransferase